MDTYGTIKAALLGELARTRERMTAHAIMQPLRIGPSGVHPELDQLVRDGHVERLVSPDDGSTTSYRITESGRAALDALAGPR